MRYDPGLFRRPSDARPGPGGLAGRLGAAVSGAVMRTPDAAADRPQLGELAGDAMKRSRTTPCRASRIGRTAAGRTHQAISARAPTGRRASPPERLCRMVT